MNTPDNNHPITPTDKLLYQWCVHNDQHATIEEFWEHLATQAAQWGADQELEACCEWLDKSTVGMAELLRAVRRPKPPSLKEQALDELHISFDRGYLKEGAADTIRRALEALDD